MTILEIAERVERGETVQIPASYLGVLHREVERLPGSHCWLMEIAGGVLTLRKHPSPGPDGRGANG